MKNSEKKMQQIDMFNQYIYHFRYSNGNVSKGYWTTFEKAVKAFNDCKYSGLYGELYNDLMDVVAVKKEVA